MCWVLQEPQRLLPRLHLLMRLEQAMAQGCVRLLQSLVWLRWGTCQRLLLHPVLVTLVRQDEAGCEAPSWASQRAPRLPWSPQRAELIRLAMRCHWPGPPSCFLFLQAKAVLESLSMSYSCRKAVDCRIGGPNAS